MQVLLFTGSLGIGILLFPRSSSKLFRASSGVRDFERAPGLGAVWALAMVEMDLSMAFGSVLCVFGVLWVDMGVYGSGLNSGNGGIGDGLY